MTDDQHRIGKLSEAALIVSSALERFTALQPDQRPEPYNIGTWVIGQLQNAGWKMPPDPTADVPPLRGESQIDGPGYAAFCEAKAALKARHHPDQ